MISLSAAHIHKLPRTYHIRDDPIRHLLAVPIPIRPILVPTRLVVPDLTVQEQDDEEDEVKVGYGGVQAGGETPCQAGGDM